MNRPKYEVAHIIDQFGDEFVDKHNPNTWALRILNALRVCRTSVLGGHKEQCDSCGKTHVSYNSCKNRHCPKCQASKQAFWVEDASERIIDTKYFHIVFTIPEELNTICLLDSRRFYGIMFSSMWSTLRTLGYIYYGAETGALAILHTWGQNLSLHPHIHCLVPAAGVSFTGHVKKISKNGKYLYPVKKLSIDFRGIMMKKLKKQLSDMGMLDQHQAIIDIAWIKNWVVFSEPSFGDAEHVIKYLGKYTHRVAISNNRIQKVTKNHVHFYYKDYNDKSTVKMTVLTGVEFLRRFCMHILPKGFVKIRYYGILSNRFSKQMAMYRKPKTKVAGETSGQRVLRLMGFDVHKCPFCGNGTMYRVDVIPRVRSPNGMIKLGTNNK